MSNVSFVLSDIIHLPLCFQDDQNALLNLKLSKFIRICFSAAHGALSWPTTRFTLQDLEYLQERILNMKRIH